MQFIRKNVSILHAETFILSEDCFAKWKGAINPFPRYSVL